VPTPEELTCVNFQYGIGNGDGFSADDIFNEKDNTLKTGLTLATRNVTIDTLNTTLPRNESMRLLQRNLQRSHRPLTSSTKGSTYLASRALEIHRHHQLVSISTTGSRLQVNDLGRLHLVDQDIVVESEVARAKVPSQKNQVRRRNAYLPSGQNTVDDRRSLAFYTDEFQPTINSILDNPFCPNFPEFECAVVDSTVCVLLEEGDDEEMVRMVLLGGIEQAILDGSFQAAIPPEHQLPSGGDIENAT
jgi:hypothetical protein